MNQNYHNNVNHHSIIIIFFFQVIIYILALLLFFLLLFLLLFSLFLDQMAFITFTFQIILKVIFTRVHRFRHLNINISLLLLP